MISRFEERKLNDIKKLINDTAKKYNNFNSFSIVQHEFIEDMYNVFLLFNNDEKSSKDYIIQIELIQNVLYEEIPKVIESVSIDFDNFYGIEIINDKERDHLVHIILKFLENKQCIEFNPVKLVEHSWSGGSKLGGCETELNILKYQPKNLFWGEKLNNNIYITNRTKGMLIRIGNNYDNYDLLFEVKWDKESCEYLIIEYDKFSKVNWSNKIKIINETRVDKLNVNIFANEIIRRLESELNIKASKRSYKTLEEKIIYMSQVGKIEYLK